MPTLISTDEFRERFDIDSEIKDTRLEPHIGSASRRLRKWVSDATYDAAVSAADPGQDLDTDTVNDLKNAEAHLAMHYALLGLNSPLSGKGVLATATATEGREVRRYLNPGETRDLAGQFLDLAREIAEPYCTSDGTPGAGFEMVDVGDCCLPDTSCEAVTRSVC